MILQSLAGLPAFLVYFCTGLVAVVAFLFVYPRRISINSSHPRQRAIGGDRVGLSLLGFVLPGAQRHRASRQWGGLPDLGAANQQRMPVSSLAGAVCRRRLRHIKFKSYPGCMFVFGVGLRRTHHATRDTRFDAVTIHAVANCCSGISRVLPVSDGPGMQAVAEGSSASGPDGLPLCEPARQCDVGRQGGNSQEERADGEAQQTTWAEQLSARLRVTLGIDIEDIGWCGDSGFVDLDNRAITLAQALSWEWMFHDAFGAKLASTPTRWIEPPWKAVLSNKGILPLLWRCFRDQRVAAATARSGIAAEPARGARAAFGR